MPDLKRILFLMVIFLSFYLLYCLLERRRNLMADLEVENQNTQQKEPFEILSRISHSENMILPLKEYVVMSSWNSATDSNGNVSLNTLDNVLKRGYRFIDLEIYSVDDKPCVGFTAQKTNDTMDSSPISFLDVCRHIMLQGFSTNNGKDPLFLHLRIKSTNYKILEKMADVLLQECKNRLFDGDVDGDTRLASLKSKLVIIVDRNYFSQSETYKCIGSCTNDFTKLINLYSGTPDLESMPFVHKLQSSFIPLQQARAGLTNVEKLKMVIHQMGSLNIEHNGSEFFTLVRNHSIQVFPQKVYFRDANLFVYEDFFTNNGHRAFVPMSVAFEYIFNELE